MCDIPGVRGTVKDYGGEKDDASEHNSAQAATASAFCGE